MSILTNTNIKEILCKFEQNWNRETQLLIQDYDESCLTPMGYDLRVGGFYKTFSKTFPIVGKSIPKLVTLNQEDKVLIQPGDIVLIGTLEQIKMPQNGLISALIFSKVSQVSQGLSHISTKVDPGWAEGELIIPVQNFSLSPIELKYGEKFCTIIFLENKSPASPLYSSNNSRSKFVQLLAQIKDEYFWKEAILYIVEVSIILAGVLLAVVIGNNYSSDNFNFAAAAALIIVPSIAISKLLREFLNIFLSTR